MEQMLISHFTVSVQLNWSRWQLPRDEGRRQQGTRGLQRKVCLPFVWMYCAYHFISVNLLLSVRGEMHTQTPLVYSCWSFSWIGRVDCGPLKQQKTTIFKIDFLWFCLESGSIVLGIIVCFTTIPSFFTNWHELANSKIAVLLLINISCLRIVKVTW